MTSVLIIITSGLAPSSDADVVTSNSNIETFIAKTQACRFLAQASMGGTVQEIDALALRIKAIGHTPACEEWIDKQLAIPRSSTYKDQINQMIAVDGSDPNKTWIGDYYDYAWWDQAINSPDQLRQRMGFALSQIFVVSSRFWGSNHGNNRWHSYANFHDDLMKNAFGKHVDILRDITYSPMMGNYLSYAQNAPANPELGTFPDENYAREIMQLFSCGVFSRDFSGRIYLDSDGNARENYNNDDIREFAQVFTGLAQTRGERGQYLNDFLTAPFGSPAYVLAPMIMDDQYHDKTSKILLNGKVLPANQSGSADLEATFDHLAHHPSTAPFLAEVLIKRFTSSNPSVSYIRRVTDAWRGVGTYANEADGHGDLKVVLKAILLDPEARNAVNYRVVATDANNSHVITSPVDPLAGKVKEPILRYTQFYRFAGASSLASDRALRLAETSIPGDEYQGILKAKSVFNFYDYDYAPASGPIGEYRNSENIDLTAPELQILGANFIKDSETILSGVVSGTLAGSIDSTIKLFHTNFLLNELRGDTTMRQMIVYFDQYLCAGQMSSYRQFVISQNYKGTSPVFVEFRNVLSVLLISTDYSVLH